MKLNNKQQNTLDSIRKNPVLKTIKWNDVESLVIALGGKIEQGNGSRVRIVIYDMSLNIHTPHPGNELKPYQVRSVRKLLSDAGDK